MSHGTTVTLILRCCWFRSRRTSICPARPAFSSHAQLICCGQFRSPRLHIGARRATSGTPRTPRAHSATTAPRSSVCGCRARHRQRCPRAGDAQRRRHRHGRQVHADHIQQLTHRRRYLHGNTVFEQQGNTDYRQTFACVPPERKRRWPSGKMGVTTAYSSRSRCAVSVGAPIPG
jgi:hypothetical protein